MNVTTFGRHGFHTRGEGLLQHHGVWLLVVRMLVIGVGMIHYATRVTVSTAT